MRPLPRLRLTHQSDGDFARHTWASRPAQAGFSHVPPAPQAGPGAPAQAGFSHVPQPRTPASPTCRRPPKPEAECRRKPASPTCCQPSRSEAGPASLTCRRPSKPESDRRPHMASSNCRRTPKPEAECRAGRLLPRGVSTPRRPRSACLDRSGGPRRPQSTLSCPGTPPHAWKAGGTWEKPARAGAPPRAWRASGTWGNPARAGPLPRDWRTEARGGTRLAPALRLGLGRSVCTRGNPACPGTSTRDWEVGDTWGRPACAGRPGSARVQRSLHPVTPSPLHPFTLSPRHLVTPSPPHRFFAAAAGSAGIQSSRDSR